MWTDQLMAWLQEDMMTSAWVWRRIVLFMRKHKYYLLHPALAHPAELGHIAQFGRDNVTT